MPGQHRALRSSLKRCIPIDNPGGRACRAQRRSATLFSRGLRDELPRTKEPSCRNQPPPQPRRRSLPGRAKRARCRSRLQGSPGAIALTFGSVLTFGEEYGWRGYLLPKLLPLGEVKAAIVVGLIWGPWHAPMLAAGLNYSSVNPLAAIGIFVVTATALSLLLTRAYLAAGGALLVPVIMHASFNRFGDTLTNTDHLSGDPLLVTPGGLVGIALILATVVTAHAFGRKRGERSATPTPVAAPHRAAS
jgi:Type II CAAX prenyl endopeptidase Rce1-like